MNHVSIITERLSTRLLILQSVLSVGRVWPQLPSRLGMQLKVWACMKTSVPLRNAIKRSCLQKVVYISVLFSAVAVRAVSLSRRQN